MIDPRAAAERSLARIAADRRAGIWIELLPPTRVLAAADAVAARVRAGEDLPLAGRSLAVKGNIDVAGVRTTAGCPSYGEVAAVSAPAVHRLEDAGAVVVGVTNLDQFATGLVGTRSPYGVCPNAHWPDLISGGSSSGSAVAVAAGLVDLALGTDTAGSGRVPAAANAIVGLKPTRGWISTAGVVPACHSLDCVSVFAGTVELALQATLAAAGPDADDPWGRTAPAPLHTPGDVRFGMPRGADLVLGGPITAALFREATAAVAAGSPLKEIDLAPFVDTGRLLYEGAFVAERYAAVGPFVEAAPDGLDPVVAGIIADAGKLPAWQLAADRTELERLRRLAAPTWDTIDVLVVPSVPRLPSPAEVAANPIGTNAALGHYTNFVNLLDLCALTIPVGPALPHHPPVSVTLIAPAWRDQLLADVAARAFSVR